MIVFVAPRDHFGIEKHLEIHGKDLATQFQLLSYEELWHRQTLPTGTYIFAALDLLNPAQANLVSAAWDTLSKHGVPLLNDPRRFQGRYELLSQLQARAWNRFSVFHASEASQVDRFPVFIRKENDHNGSRSTLLYDHTQIRKELLRLRLRGHLEHELMIIEFCDTVDDKGYYRKYSAFAVGNIVIPCHIFFGRQWMVKHEQSHWDPEKISLEYDYIFNNPHADHLSKVGRLAGIDYGRIDYGIFDQQPQIWEINTNPTLRHLHPPPVSPPGLEEFRSLREPGRTRFRSALHEAFAGIDCHLPASPEIPFQISDGLRRDCERAGKPSSNKKRLRRLANKPILRWAKPAIEPLAVGLLRMLPQRRTGQ